jgi:hydrogenase nickel incorporation protein HypB
MEITVIKNILEANDAIALTNKQTAFNRGITMINIIGSPGAGKTSVILKAVEQLSLPVGVIEGDITSDIDSRMMAENNIPVVQINTGGACHLDANMISKALEGLDFSQGLLFIENVGNLVCPAEFEVGEDFKVALCSVAEGDDKSYKYPLIFSKARAVVLNKIDLLPYLDFDKKIFYQGVRTLNPGAPIFQVSAKTGQGIREWSQWLKQQHHKNV